MVSLAASALFCTPGKPWLCGSVWTQVSAAVVALGAAMWVTAQHVRLHGGGRAFEAGGLGDGQRRPAVPGCSGGEGTAAP